MGFSNIQEIEHHNFLYLVELSGEELNAHDGKDKPEDDTDEEHVEYARDGLHQRVHHNLHPIQH